MEIPQWAWGAIIGALATIFTAFLGKVITRFYDEYRDKVLRRTQARGDLKGLITLLINVWRDREFIMPHVKFRKELVEHIRNIREKTTMLPLDLPPEILDELRVITNEFLDIINKKPNISDYEWSQCFSMEIEGICLKLERWKEKLS
ncbi:MAG: hypothetical protein QW660_07975 [Candidatus Bathyarchaeia archaeon]